MAHRPAQLDHPSVQGYPPGDEGAEPQGCAARLKTFEPMTTPAPTWCSLWLRAVMGGGELPARPAARAGDDAEQCLGEPEALPNPLDPSLRGSQLVLKLTTSTKNEDDCSEGPVSKRGSPADVRLTRMSVRARAPGSGPSTR